MTGRDRAIGLVRDYGHLLVPIGIGIILAAMIVPLPPFILDILISANIALAIVVLMSAVYVPKPVDFSVFPSMLLLLTIFRLGLNVASTRRILMHGSEGTSAAGRVIESFGQFVVGGNLVVGLVVFLVLIAIQFIVINHGATRISEVTARFTLDAMPGKQMAIDADLNAGIITDREARDRRTEISKEAEFYGSMDGAVRFTQRDAVASLIIVAINILGGLVIGIVQQGVSPYDAMTNYTILTVGDGLVTAIPALLVAVSGGLTTTRATTGNSLGDDVVEQVFSKQRPLVLAAGAMGTLAIIPGLPTIPFVLLGGMFYGLSRILPEAAAPPEADLAEAHGPPAEEPVEPLLAVDPLALEVGYDLIGCVGSDGSGGVLDKIRGIRRQVAQELGFVLPPVRIRDNLRLAPDAYAVMLRGVEIATGTIRRGSLLAICPSPDAPPIEGVRTTDPAFGIEALWIPESKAEEARVAGYTVVDPASVISTHLLEVIRKHAHELLGREDVQGLLDNLSKTAPRTVEELVPQRLTLGQVQSVLRALLRDKVPIRDLATIAEALSDASLASTEPVFLVESVRQSIGRAICAPLLNERGELEAVTVDPRVEHEIEQTLRGPAVAAGENEMAGKAVAKPAAGAAELQALVARIARACQQATTAGGHHAVLCSPVVRPYLSRLASSALPGVTFLSPQEIPPGARVRSVAMVT